MSGKLLNEDDLREVLRWLPLKEKVRFRRVDEKWGKTLSNLLKHQQKLRMNFKGKGGPFEGFCRKKCHSFRPQDNLPLEFDKSMSRKEKDALFDVLEKVLVFCPNIKVVSMVGDDDVDPRRVDPMEPSKGLAFGRGFDLIADHCPQLECVEFFCESVAGDAFSMQTMTALQEIYIRLVTECKRLVHISFAGILDSTLKAIFQNLPEVEALNLLNYYGGSHHFKNFGANVKGLLLNLEIPESKEHLLQLVQSKAKNSLERLDLRRPDGETLEIIGENFVNLKKLDLRNLSGHAKVVVEDVQKAFKSMKKMEKLILDSEINRSLESPIIGSLIFWKNLKSLTLFRVLVSDKLFQELATSCLELKAVFISMDVKKWISSEILLSDKALVSLVKLPKLSTLSINYYNTFTDKGLAKMLTSSNALIYCSILYNCKNHLFTKKTFNAAVSLARKRSQDVTIKLSVPHFNEYTVPKIEGEPRPLNLLLYLTDEYCSHLCQFSTSIALSASLNADILEFGERVKGITIHILVK